MSQESNVRFAALKFAVEARRVTDDAVQILEAAIKFHSYLSDFPAHSNEASQGVNMGRTVQGVHFKTHGNNTGSTISTFDPNYEKVSPTDA